MDPIFFLPVDNFKGPQGFNDHKQLWDKARLYKKSFLEGRGKLPEKISDLDKTNFAFQAQKGSTLEYQKTGEDKFVLCANFVRSNENDPQEITNISFDKEWKHTSGKACFDRIALQNNVPNVKN